MLLSEALTGDVSRYLAERDTVLIPIGSLEQHWKAAPLACDTIIPVMLCREASIRTGVAVAPAVSYGCSENHMAFAGTVSLDPRTLALTVRDLAVSLHAHGFRKILLLSGHGGNREAVENGLDEAAGNCSGSILKYILYRDLPGAVEKQKQLFCPDPGYHVTVTEVSMIWHLLGKDIPDFPRMVFPPEPSAGEKLSREEWKNRYPMGGAGSDLKHVSAARGEEFFEFLVNSLCSLVHDLEEEGDKIGIQ